MTAMVPASTDGSSAAGRIPPASGPHWDRRAEDGPASTAPRSSHRAIRIVARTLLATPIWLAGVTGYVAWTGAHDDAAPADAIIVLGAAAYDTKPSPVFEQRIVHALSLYRRGLAPRIVFTGGFGGPARFSESQVARRYALQHGIPARSILIESRSGTTRENLAEAAKLLRPCGVKRVIVVSDPPHVARALLLARARGLQAVGSPTPTSRFITPRVRLLFLAREVAELHGELWLWLRAPTVEPKHTSIRPGEPSACAVGRATRT